jgi:hypothetical protein
MPAAIACRLAFDDIQELLFGDLGFAEQRQLQQFAFDHFLCDIDQRVQDVEILFFEGNCERLHIKPVAGKNRH